MRYLSVAAICVLLAAPSAARAFDFKGLVIGEPTTAEQIEARLKRECAPSDDSCTGPYRDLLERGRVRCGDGANGAKVCNGVTSVAGFAAQANVVINPAGVLRRVLVTLSPGDFEVVASELKKKFGKPTTEKADVLRNAYGANFNQVELIWNDENGRQIHYRRYAGSVKQSTLYFSTEEDRRSMNAAPAKAGDL